MKNQPDQLTFAFPVPMLTANTPYYVYVRAAGSGYEVAVEYFSPLAAQRGHAAHRCATALEAHQIANVIESLLKTPT